MEAILLRLESRLQEVTQTLADLKAENEILRKKILGNGNNTDTSNPPQSLGSSEGQTLWGIVEEIQTQIKELNANIIHGESPAETAPEEIEEYEVVAIRSKTIADERTWIKTIFNEILQGRTATNGSTLREKTFEDMVSSLPFAANVGVYCALKLSNFLERELTDPKYHFWHGSKKDQFSVTKIYPNVCEVITFVGDRYYCYFLCSFRICRDLRLTILCYVCYNGEIIFGMGFTPTDLPVDTVLFKTMNELPPLPDIWMTKQTSKVPIEVFVNHGNIFARGHITNGPRSVVHVEIIERKDKIFTLNSSSPPPERKSIVNGKTLKSIPYSKVARAILKMNENQGGFSCSIEIANGLNVKLRNWNQFNCNSKSVNFLPSEVLPFTRELFFAKNDTIVEAMFSYEIDTTDLGLVIALRCSISSNSFAAEFVPLPAVTGGSELQDLMQSNNNWKSFLHRKQEDASKWEQIIQMRNIRAVITMTEEDHSYLKIRVLAV